MLKQADVMSPARKSLYKIAHVLDSVLLDPKILCCLATGREFPTIHHESTNFVHDSFFSGYRRARECQHGTVSGSTPS